MQTQGNMADSPADPDQLPPRVHRAFIVTFVTGLIQLLPAALITYFSVALSVLTYGSWHVDSDLDFLNDGNQSNNPIVMRRAVPRDMVLLICVFTIAFLLLDLQCIFAIVVGCKGRKKASAERVTDRVCPCILCSFFNFRSCKFASVVSCLNSSEQ